MRIGSPQNSFGMFRADAPFSRLLRRECLQLARTKSSAAGHMWAAVDVSVPSKVRATLSRSCLTLRSGTVVHLKKT